MNQVQQAASQAQQGQVALHYHRSTIPTDDPGKSKQVPVAPTTPSMVKESEVYCHRIKNKSGHAVRVPISRALKKQRPHLNVCQKCGKCIQGN